MRTIKTSYGLTADISEERILDYSKEFMCYSLQSLYPILEQLIFFDSYYIRQFLKERNYEETGKITIRKLDAHGYSNVDYGFLYADLIEEKLVWEKIDNWIEKHDGKYEILYISSCNIGEIILNPKKSAIIYPLGRCTGLELWDSKIPNNIFTILYPENPSKPK